MDNLKEWEKFLNPQQLKTNLIQAGLYIVAYEMFKSAVIDKVKGFFTFEFRRDGKTNELMGIPSPDYQKEVLSLYPRDEFTACCSWFVKMNALEHEDLDGISAIRRHRNEVVHELPKIITSTKRQIREDLLIQLLEIKKKLDIWWVREIEFGINPYLDKVDANSVNWNDVAAVDTITLSLMASIFSGDDEYLRMLYNQFMELSQKMQKTSEGVQAIQDTQPNE